MKPKIDGVLIFIEILYIIILIFGIEYACEEAMHFLDTGGINMTKEWMEILKSGIIGTAIGAVVSLISAYFMYLGKTKQILEIVQELKGERFNRIREDSKELSQKSDKLSAGHDKLSAEHGKLSAEHDKIREDLFKIYLNQEKEKTARETAAKQMPEEGKLLDLVKMIYDNHTKLIERNKELIMEVSRLQMELEQYRQEYEQEDMDFSEYEMVPDDQEMEML